MLMVNLITLFRIENTNFQTTQFGYSCRGPELWLSAATFPLSVGKRQTQPRLAWPSTWLRFGTLATPGKESVLISGSAHCAAGVTNSVLRSEASGKRVQTLAHLAGLFQGGDRW